MGHHLVTEDIPMTPDNFAWAVGAMHYPLPKGLPHRSLVKIVRNDVGDTQIHVVDAEGNPWSLNRSCLIPRVRYRSKSGPKLGEKSYPEHSDEAQNLLTHEIGHLERELKRIRKEIEAAYWAVRRSGNATAIAALEKRLADHNPIADYEIEIPTDCHPLGPNQR